MVIKLNGKDLRMILEDLVMDIHRPLIALQIINDVIEQKLVEEWKFFQKETYQEAEELTTMILINQRIIKYLLKIRQKYCNAVDEIYRISS